MSDLSSMSIRLGLNAKDFTVGLGKVRDQLNGFRTSAAGKFLFGGGSLGKAIGGSVGGLVGGAARSLGQSGSGVLGAGFGASPIGMAAGLVVETGRKLKEAVDWAESVGQQQLGRFNRNKRLGIGGISGSALESLAGPNADRLFEAMPKLQKLIGAAGEGSDEAKRKLQGLGLSFGELRRMAPDDALVAVSKKIVGLGSDAERTRAAFNLFEEAGPALITTLQRIASGFESARTNAAGMGNQPSELIVDSAKRLTKAQQQFDREWDGVKNTRLAPVIAAFNDTKSSIFESGIEGTLHKFGKAHWVSYFDMLTGYEREDPAKRLAAENKQKQLKQMQAEAEAGKAAKNLFEGDLRTALDQVDTERRVLGEDPTTKRLVEFEKRAKALGVTTPLLAQFGAALQNLRNDQFNQSLVDSNRELETQIATFGKASWEVKRYQLEVDAASKGVNDFTEQMQRQVDLTARLDGKKLDDAARTPLENAQREFGRLEDLKRRGALSDRGYNAALTRTLMGLDNRLAEPPPMPRALEMGSAEAVSFITRAKYEAQSGKSDALENRIPQILESLKAKHEEQIETEKRVADACEGILGTLVVASI